MNTGVLNNLRTRLAGWLGLSAVLWLFGVLGLAALALVLGDAALDLPESLRAAAPWVLGLFAAAVLAISVWQWRRLGERRVARLFERAEPALGDRLTNAVQLAGQSGSSGVEEFLRREAVDLGHRSATGLRAWPVMRRGFQWAAGLAARWAWRDPARIRSATSTSIR